LHRADDGLFGQRSKHMYVAFLTLLSQTNLTFYDIPYSNITYIQVFAYIVIKKNIEFDHWTQYSTESAMCHCLIILTNLFLLLNKVVNQVSFHLEWLVYLIWWICTKLFTPLEDILSSRFFSYLKICSLQDFSPT
jgi:hypothetical protein